MLENNLAYPCFCTNEELEAKQERSKKLGIPHVYDGKCKNLSPKEVEEKKKQGIPYAIRFKVEPKEVVVDDIVQGRVKFDSRLIGDFIIVKSDGFPSYNYAVVIDDYEMKISHVIRGVGHLSNTPRQILIHEALKLPLPKYAHISEIVGTDKKKLSKRRGATSVMFFKELGYLSEALVNYMALLGWYPEDGVEFMPDGELLKKFDIERCSKSPAMFDFFLIEKNSESEQEEIDVSQLSIEEIKQMINPKTKLNWMNQKYIRYYSVEKVYELAKPFLLKDSEVQELIQNDESKVKDIFASIRDYLVTLDDAIPYIKELSKDEIQITEEAKNELKSLEEKQPGAEDLINIFIDLIKKENPDTEEEYSNLIKQAGKLSNRKGRFLFMPIRIYTTGKIHGLELPRLFYLLGKDRILKRIDYIKQKLQNQ
ncbi:MAG: glutamate--tRNA ligase [Leptospiraceae bacterium]|nr:MAG: glutamate--tRNA ligase [Leptospiraceae bacterium]